MKFLDAESRSRNLSVFVKENWGEIEQELLNIKEELAPLCPLLTDALRIQTLCDHQEGDDGSQHFFGPKNLIFSWKNGIFHSPQHL